MLLFLVVKSILSCLCMRDRFGYLLHFSILIIIEVLEACVYIFIASIELVLELFILPEQLLL